MKVIFCASSKLGSRLIRLFNLSRYSHVVIVDGGNIIEATWPRVRVSNIAKLSESHYLRELAEIPCIDEAAALAFARAQVGKRYDWRGLFGFFSPGRNWHDPASWFCSELVAAAINAGGVPIFRDASHVSPQMLYLVSREV